MKKILLCLLLMAPGLARADLEISIAGGETGAVPIAVVPFQAPADLKDDFAGVIANDLARSGRFKPVARQQMLEQPTDASQVNFRNWRMLNVEHVVTGKLVRAANGKLSVQYQVSDVFRAKTELTSSVPVQSAQRLRLTAHQVADQIFEKLTGIKGVFSTQIAYVTATGRGDDRQFKLMVADADGANPVEVVVGPDPIMSPQWSPDARRLAFVTYDYDHSHQTIWTVTLATREMRKILTERGINSAPAWSPDGQKIAVTLSFGSNPDIYVVNVATHERQRLTEHFAIDTEPAWSPDGSQIAFTSDRGGQPQVYVVGSSGGTARRVTFEGKQNLRPNYSPDGKSLVLVNNDDMGYRIGVLDLKSQQLRILSDGPLDESPSFAPNGAMVIYSAQGKQGAEIDIVSIDGRYRQRLTQSGDVREPAWSPLPQ